MTYPEPYIDYLVEFHATRDYFECHELLEEYWKTLPKGHPLSDTWVGLIQLAVAQYHHRRGNLVGAVKMLAQAERRLAPNKLGELGLDGEEVLRWVRRHRERLESAPSPPAFEDIKLPLTDPRLLEACIAASSRRGEAWGAASRMDDPDLIDRHTRRDRSEVVAARKASLEAKTKKPDERP